jgi:hypothetical protein
MINAGDRMRDGHNQQVRPGKSLFSPAPNTKSTSHQSSLGILVYSHAGHLLHMNRRAWAMTGHLNQAETGPPTMTLSSLVSELRLQLQDILDSRLAANVWEASEVKRVLSEFGRTIVLRGFALPNRDSSNDSRVIIILEEVSRQQACGASQAQAQVPARNREGAAAEEHAPFR